MVLGKTTHKITLYAEDNLLFLSMPEVSVLATGYKVNYTISEKFLGNYGSTSSDTVFPLRWAASGFVYLGISVT